jgi:hypothetical protein
MANGVIKNAQTIAFRGSTLSLGDSLVGTVAIDCSIADVHTGKLNGDILLDFQKWAPAGTRGTVEVILTVSPGQKIQITSAVTYGVKTIKGYTVPSSGNPYILVPSGVDRVHYVFSSLDCGTTIEINQLDDVRRATTIRTGIPTSDIIVTNKMSVTNASTAITFASAVTIPVGTQLYTTANVLIGQLAAGISGSTSGTLTSAATIATGSYDYYKTSSAGRTGDQQGDIMVNGGFIYVCQQDFSSSVTANIWTRTALGTTSW